METSLYLPVKRFLEGLGYTVKGEIGNCDLVALRDDDPAVVVIGELKLSFNLELVLQGVDRMSVGDEIWLAAQLSVKGKGREGDPRYRNLCRRLGFGLLGVGRAGEVEVLVSPTAPTPRKDPRRRSRLVDEHRRRRGDPAAGGSTRQPIMTAYRQQALACAAAMATAPQRPRDLRPSCPDAQKILHRNVYGWFERSGAESIRSPRRGAAPWRRGVRRRFPALRSTIGHPRPCDRLAHKGMTGCLPSNPRNIISFGMVHDHAHHRQPAAEAPGWSLLRLSAGQRLGLALGVILVLWAATLAVIA